MEDHKVYAASQQILEKRLLMKGWVKQKSWREKWIIPNVPSKAQNVQNMRSNWNGLPQSPQAPEENAEEVVEMHLYI